jgi:hypothetical protein
MDEIFNEGEDEKNKQNSKKEKNEKIQDLDKN